ncbi:MAG: NDP-sugar synthase [Deltaproteobacteria bacterium]|nr:NDP-sugar synthase [Deltaproteobacteria bacterium]
MMKIRKAMLFSAGFGERLRPLTLKTPKPLLPVGDRPLIDYALAYLKRFGIEEVIVNLHHLGELFEKHCGNGRRYGLKIIYTKEKVLLGTGGGLKNAEEHFKNEEAFFTLNSAALTNCDLDALTTFHQEQSAAVTLVVRPWQEGYTRVCVEGRQYKKVGKGNHLFTGLMVMTPAIFSELELRDTNLITEGVDLLQQKGTTIAAFEHDGYWRKIENSKDYEAVQQEWASGHQTRIG